MCFEGSAHIVPCITFVWFALVYMAALACSITSALQEATAMAGVRTELVVNVDEPSCSEVRLE